MNLTTTWLDAELNSGKSQAQAIRDLNKAIGYKANYAQVLRWKTGEREPRQVVRVYMLRIAIPHLIKGVNTRQINILTEALK